MVHAKIIQSHLVLILAVLLLNQTRNFERKIIINFPRLTLIVFINFLLMQVIFTQLK